LAKSKKKAVAARAVDVRDQYELYPYPLRNPEDDRTRLVRTVGGNLDGINQAVFGGRRDFSKPFRVLVAGGGTGDTLIYLAQQMADRGIPGEVIYADLSTASRRIAEQRAAVRGLKITFITGSLLDIARLAPGPFDYIDCSGVLHHLPAPDAGLAALTSVLAEDGGMGLMLYGTLGRAGVYPMQAMLRQLAPDLLPAAERIAICRKLIAALPATNPLRRNPILEVSPNWDDNELFDMFLHSQDRSYTVDEIARMADAAGLRTTSFVPAAQYEPASFCPDPSLMMRLDGTSPVQRAALAESLSAIAHKHIFTLVRRDNPVVAPTPADPNAIPVWHDGFTFPADDIGGTYQFGKTRGPVITQITVTPAVAAVAKRIDGNTPLHRILHESHLPPPAFGEALRTLWSLHGVHYLFLKV
jgi:SAM-dependent methyltransferase